MEFSKCHLSLSLPINPPGLQTSRATIMKGVRTSATVLPVASKKWLLRKESRPFEGAGISVYLYKHRSAFRSVQYIRSQIKKVSGLKGDLWLRSKKREETLFPKETSDPLCGGHLATLISLSWFQACGERQPLWKNEGTKFEACFLWLAVDWGAFDLMYQEGMSPVEALGVTLILKLQETE